jgi:hypothetical protein
VAGDENGRNRSRLFGVLDAGTPRMTLVLRDRLSDAAKRRVDADAGLAIRTALVSASDLDSLETARSLVAGVLERDTLAVLYGPPGCGKTFCSLQLSACIATGCPWHGREVSQGRVLYVLAEGQSGLRRRRDALIAHHGWAPEQLGGLTFIPRRVSLLDPAQSGTLRALVAEQRPALVVVDTLARAMAGGDENGKGMAEAVEAADELREVSGACVLLVHHTSKGGRDERGHTSLRGAASTMLRVTKAGALVTIEGTKARDGEPFLRTRYRLTEAGDSCVLTPDTATAVATTPTERILDALRAAGEPMSKTAIYSQVRGNKAQCMAAIDALSNDGDLIRDNDGRWRLP